MPAARVGDDREEQLTRAGEEARPRREIQAPRRANRVRRAVALARVGHREEQRVDRLVPLEVDDPQDLAAVDTAQPRFAGEDDFVPNGARRVAGAFDERVIWAAGSSLEESLRVFEGAPRLELE